jgi:mono/diheme cytochrome c family protein
VNDVRAPWFSSVARRALRVATAPGVRRFDRVLRRVRSTCAPLALAACVLAGLNGVAGAQDRSRQNYIRYCAGCHQLDGSGSPSAGIPDMREQVGYFLHSENGRAFLVQVPGSANSPLSDRELALLVNWIVQTFSAAQMPAATAPYTEDEVRRLRADRPAAIADFRRDVVAELQRLGYAVR